MEAHDRRSYNRLEVSLLFSCQPLGPDEKAERLPLSTTGDNPFASWFLDLRPTPPPANGENDEAVVYYRKMTEYLEIVERKITLLSRIIFQPAMNDFFRQPPVPLSLSATGVSFPAAAPLDVGSRVLLTFFLPHAARLIAVPGLILRSTVRESRDSRQACLVAAQFMDLDQETEDEIARFIILSERKQLRQARQHHEEKA
jgi:hypothetical protein